MSLDDIWAEPIETTAISGTSNSEATLTFKKARPALFFSDSEEEDTGNVSRRQVIPHPASPGRDKDVPWGPDKAQLDVMFTGIDDDDDPFNDIAPAVDIDNLKRQVAAEVAKATSPPTSFPSLGGGSNAIRDKDKGDQGIKTNRMLPKLNEERLLGDDGFPRLLKGYKNFKVTGKGHESADLAKLFRMYHAWTHKMYPKFQFRDTVDRVEKLCRSRRMAVNLKVWREEAHGMTSEVQHKVSQSDDGTNSEQEGEKEDDPSVPGPISPSSSRPSTPVTRPSSSASTAPSVPSSATDMDNDMDIDALLREEEEIMREMNGVEKETSYYKLSNNAENDEDALWGTAGRTPKDAPDMGTGPGLTASTFLGEADGEDMWNMFDEMENQRSSANDGVDNRKSETTVTNEAAAQSPPAIPEQPIIGADWDDMYE